MWGATLRAAPGSGINGCLLGDRGLVALALVPEAQARLAVGVHPEVAHRVHAAQQVLEHTAHLVLHSHLALERVARGMRTAPSGALALPRLRPRRRGRHGRWGPQLKWASSTSRPSTSRSTSRRRPPREPQGSTAHAALRSTIPYATDTTGGGESFTRTRRKPAPKPASSQTSSSTCARTQRQMELPRGQLPAKHH
eukprot:COSAG01_NODE_19736_length_992_cov_3.367301_1_plen_195_part_10